MTKKFKLKKEARVFFKNDLHTCILSLEDWKKQNIHINLLEPVENIHVVYGIKDSETTKRLKSFSNMKGCTEADFHFTIKMEDITQQEYENMNIAEMMDIIENSIRKYYDHP